HRRGLRAGPPRVHPSPHEQREEQSEGKPANEEFLGCRAHDSASHTSSTMVKTQPAEPTIRPRRFPGAKRSRNESIHGQKIIERTKRADVQIPACIGTNLSQR